MPPSEGRRYTLAPTAVDRCVWQMAARVELGEELGADEVEGVVDEGLDAFEEEAGAGEGGVDVEGGFVASMGVDLEKAGIAGGAEGVDAEAAGFLARGVPRRHEELG
jgi:hypothetical protein